MQIKVGCTLEYTVSAPTPMVLIIRPANDFRHRLVSEVHQTTPVIWLDDYLDQFGNRVWRLVAPVGPMRIHYDAQIEIPPTPDLVFPTLGQTAVEYLPYDVLPYTLPSRYCDSDLLLDEAWQLFGTTALGWARVQAICDWIHAEVTYGAGSTSQTTGYQAYQQRRGVCRDFAHIAISFYRALNIPARYVCGYLPDIGVPLDPAPMDFHAWFEAYLDGAWHTFDARHNRPRIGRVVVGRGRDAIDVALATSYGPSELTTILVWAEELSGSSPTDYE